MPTTNDAFLWYNVQGWERFGLAVPNWSDDVASQNETIRYLVEITGRNLQGIMWHTDAMLRTPPSINTITRIHKLCTRARSLLAGRAVPAGTLNMEPAHALPAPEAFKVFPCPYFTVRNPWLKEYCGHVLTALTEAMQHSENFKPLEISLDFAGLFGQYIQRVYKTLAVELLKVPAADASKPDFALTDVQLAAYNPSAWFTSTEMIDTAVPAVDRPTEDALKVLTDGIPVPLMPDLGPYPSGLALGSSGSASASASGQVSADSFAPAPGV